MTHLKLAALALAVVRAWLSAKALKGQSSMESLVESNNFPGQGGISKSRSGMFNGFLMEGNNELSLRYVVETVTKNQRYVSPMRCRQHINLL
jgi:hypothetical protein